MIGFLVKRLLMVIPTFFGITIIAFSLIRMVPGDPVLLMLGERGVSPELYAEMKATLGLDKPLISQYLLYIGNALTGDLGTSMISKRPVIEEFFGRFPATFELGTVSMIFAVLLGIPMGVFAAVRKNTFLDYSVMGASLVGYSMPIFWWGLILIMFFSVSLGWTPVSGRMSAIYDVDPVTGFMLIDTWIRGEGISGFMDALSHIILPATAMGTIPLAVTARMTRSSMLEVIGEDYIRTARAKGVKESVVIYVHALRNAMIPVMTVVGLMFGTIITGAILTETIFSWPGIGKWLVDSVTARDYPVIQGGILIIASFILIINLSVDVLYAVVNPRMRDSAK